MASYPRYAIYYAPASGSALDRFGASLLGYDAYGGSALPFPEGVTADWNDLTRDPRRYGFHATLKAPMALVTGKSEADLVDACQSFAALQRPIPVIEPTVDSISGFIAIIPARPSAELVRLAAETTEAFDSFRPSLTEEDRARRNPDKLTPRQREHLDRWGYPYVMEEFRFHMTLTGRLPSERREPVLAMLRTRFSAIGLQALPIDAIALFQQDTASARFRIIGRWAFRS